MASPACPISLPLPPKSLTHAQKKPRQIPNSLIKSEFSYLDCLQRGTVSFNGFMYSLPSRKWTLVSHLIELVKKQEDTAPSILSDAKVKFIFHKIEEIKEVHTQLEIGLKVTDRDWDKEEKISKGFVAVSSNPNVFKAYSEHINNLQEIYHGWLYCDSFSTRSRFFCIFRSIYLRILTYLLKQNQKAAADQMNICGLLLKPVQRFPQLILILKNLLKGADTAKGYKVVNIRFRY